MPMHIFQPKLLGEAAWSLHHSVRKRGAYVFMYTKTTCYVHMALWKMHGLYAYGENVEVI